MPEVESKHLYPCERCSIVDKQEIVRERIDHEFEVYTRGGHGQPELHGYETYRVCKHCNHRVLFKYESDCKLGHCGMKKIMYAGGEHYQCPFCDNKFSFVLYAVETEVGIENEGRNIL